MKDLYSRMRCWDQKQMKKQESSIMIQDLPSITWPQSDERCDYYGVCWRFRAGPQAGGTLVSGGINVAGF